MTILLLAISSTISAILAVIALIKANRISKKGLVADKPILVADYKDNGGDDKILFIRNEGQLDAEDIRFFVVKNKNQYFELDDFKNINLVSKAGNLEIKMSDFEKLTTFIIKYKSSVLNQEYKYGFEVIKKQNGIRQIGFDSESVVDYNFYRNF
jgi:hypothetical protein